MNAETASALPVAILWRSDTVARGDFLNWFLGFRVQGRMFCVALDSGRENEKAVVITR